jgi:histidine ammonia-lyase
MDTEPTHCLDGHSLGLTSIVEIADGVSVKADARSLDDMRATNGLILRAIAQGQAVYGVTTGLGPKVTERLSPEELAAFSLSTIRGRAHAVGPPLLKRVVRAAMAIRLNTLLTGVTGASPQVAEHLASCLNADLVPHIGETTSTGPADLMWGGSMGLALIGEGRFLGMPKDQVSSVALAAAEIAPLRLGPRDGLALVSHCGFSSAFAALGLSDAKSSFGWAQTAAALTLEGFRANLSPFRADVLSLRSQPGAGDAAADILAKLEGSGLMRPGAARRLQDPLSLRNIPQVHGSVLAALNVLEDVVALEINGAPDSPVVLPGTEEIVSSGNFLNPYLSVALIGMNQALVQMAAQIAARISRMLAHRFTDLPSGLNNEAAGNAGLGPLTKVSEALFAEIAHLATPPVVYPSPSADGVEDTINFAALSGRALIEVSGRLRTLLAIELIVAAHAIYLRGHVDDIAPPLRQTLSLVLEACPILEADRPISTQIEDLAQQMSSRV